MILDFLHWFICISGLLFHTLLIHLGRGKFSLVSSVGFLGMFISKVIGQVGSCKGSIWGEATVWALKVGVRLVPLAEKSWIDCCLVPCPRDMIGRAHLPGMPPLRTWIRQTCTPLRVPWSDCATFLVLQVMLVKWSWLSSLLNSKWGYEVACLAGVLDRTQAMGLGTKIW